jgi:hypothetical protein
MPRGWLPTNLLIVLTLLVPLPAIGMGSGVAVAFIFAGGETPTTLVAPGWTCTGPAQSGGFWSVECKPAMDVGDRGCQNAFVSASQPPTSFGSFGASVSCAGGAVTATCTGVGFGGSCTASLPGRYEFPLRCGAWVGGAGSHVECGVGLG